MRLVSEQMVRGQRELVEVVGPGAQVEDEVEALETRLPEFEPEV